MTQDETIMAFFMNAARIQALVHTGEDISEKCPVCNGAKVIYDCEKGCDECRRPCYECSTVASDH